MMDVPIMGMMREENQVLIPLTFPFILLSLAGIMDGVL
jgi:hypothetical protein